MARLSARDDVLARVRAALRDVPAAEAPEPARAYEPPPAPAGDPVARFAERVADYQATVRDADEPRRDHRARVRRARRAAAGRAAGAARGLAARRPELVEDDGLSAHELDALDGALTGCALAIAETGTIVLDGGERSGRRALTLVPDLHVCIVQRAHVVATVSEAIRALEGARGPFTFVSGPSATSDIELDRVEGVHGPRRLEVLLV